jgi:hypothetical protein
MHGLQPESYLTITETGEGASCALIFYDANAVSQVRLVSGRVNLFPLLLHIDQYPVAPRSLFQAAAELASVVIETGNSFPERYETIISFAIYLAEECDKCLFALCVVPGRERITGMCSGEQLSRSWKHSCARRPQRDAGSRSSVWAWKSTLSLVSFSRLVCITDMVFVGGITRSFHQNDSHATDCDREDGCPDRDACSNRKNIDHPDVALDLDGTALWREQSAHSGDKKGYQGTANEYMWEFPEYRPLKPGRFAIVVDLPEITHLAMSRAFDALCLVIVIVAESRLF